MLLASSTTRSWTSRRISLPRTWLLWFSC